jgi:hypothetical protein
MQEISVPSRYLVLCLLCSLPVPATAAAEHFFGYNQTTATDFTGVFLAPEGTAKWGPNEALNDKDRSWESGERLAIKSGSRARFDLKLQDRSGRTCIKRGIDLTNDTTFDIRDADLATCGR